MSSKKVNFVNRRRALKLTQQQVANALGKTARTIQRWELGETLPELTILETFKLCRLLSCSIDELAMDFYPEEFSGNPNAGERQGDFA